MNFFSSILPNYTPPTVANTGEIGILRERILQSLLLVFLTLATVILGMGIWSAIQEQNSFIVIFYSAMYVALLLTTASRQWAYGLRGLIATGMLFLLGISEIFESGNLGNVRMALLAFVTMVAFLFHYRFMVYTLIVSIGTLSWAGYYSNISEQATLPALANLNPDSHWIFATITFTILAIMLGGSAIVLIGGLQANFLRESELAQSLAYERDTLEDRIQERTRSLSRRVIQLRTAAEISRSISALTAPETLLQQIVELVRERFDLYYVGIFLLDAQGQNAILQAGSGEAGRRMLADHHSLAIGGSSMIGWTVSNMKARIALDVGAEAVRFNNPNLPLTRSEMALPISARGNALGAMTVQSNRPNAFDENDIAVLQGMADSLGIALDNDRLYKETRQNLEEIRALNREYLQRTWSETIALHGELAYTFDNEQVVGQADDAQTIEVPLILRDEVIGTLLLETDRASLNEDDKTFVENLTNQTAIALENARLLEETERRAIQEQKINELATRFSRSISIDDILRAAVQELGQLPNISEVSIRLSPGGADTPASTDLGSSLDYHPRNNGNGKEPVA